MCPGKEFGVKDACVITRPAYLLGRHLHFQWNSLRVRLDLLYLICLRIQDTDLCPPLRARARALRARVETTLKNRRFQPWANGQRL